MTTPLETPQPTFDELGLAEPFLKAVRDLGFAHPTPIQSKAIPIVLSGKDLIGCAQTGTGKTAAFLLPVMHRLLDLPKGGTRVLVLEPTRELAAQVEEDFRDLGKYSGLKAGTVYGGVGFGPQVTALRQGYDIIVATPGRLLDHMDRGNAKFDRMQVLVLDEADRMMDMGFLPDLRRIISRLPRQRQTLFFSATIPPEIERLSHEILRNPQAIDVGRRPQVASGITHAVYPCPQPKKLGLLSLLLRLPELSRALVFTRTKHRADRVHEALLSRGFSAGCIHGDRSQGQREEALDDFRNGKVQVLVATDIAARGLDIADLTHVINYDVPQSPEDYIHRIGRTGRAQAEGDAFTLVSFEEEAAMCEIEKTLGQSLPRVQRPDFDYGNFVPLPPPVQQKVATTAGMHSTRRPLNRRRF